MIGRLRGQLVQVEGATALIDVHGVGYEVMVPELVLSPSAEQGYYLFVRPLSGGEHETCKIPDESR